MTQTLQSKIAVISGSSAGIGASIARELASRGAHIVVNYPFSKLRSEAEAIISELPTKSIAVCADISTVDGPKTLVDAAVSEFGHIDILVNNAAFAIGGPLEQQTLQHWEGMVNLNGRGVFLLTQATLPHLSPKGGRIVNIVSVSSRGPEPYQTIYAGTKGMVDSFTRVWAKELPPKYSCTVNAVSPGPTETSGFTDGPKEILQALQPVIQSTPAEKRLGQPDEIAYAVAFLCEDRARWVNGEHLFVNGGLFID